MRNLSSLLERVSKALNRDRSSKEAVVSVIYKYTKAVVPEANLMLRDGILEIITSSTIKNEITLKEKVIKDELKDVYSVFVTRFLFK